MDWQQALDIGRYLFAHVSRQIHRMVGSPAVLRVQLLPLRTHCANRRRNPRRDERLRGMRKRGDVRASQVLVAPLPASRIP